MPSLAGIGFHCVTAVQKTKVDVFLWHIARIPHTFGKSCWANYAGTVGTRKHQTIRIGVLKCQIYGFPSDLSIIQGFCEV